MTGRRSLFVDSVDSGTLACLLLGVHPIGDGVIGNTTGSGPVIEGSSPSSRAIDI